MSDRVLCKTMYGSRLYGTNTPESDTDYKHVFMLNTRDLLMCKYREGYKQDSNPGQRNTSTDTDKDYHELQSFMKKAFSGQPFALEMLFTPKHLVLETSPEWDYLVENRSRFVSKNVMPFIGFCRTQAEKYSNKAEKYNELKTVIACITSKLKLSDRLSDAGEDFWAGLKYFYIGGPDHDRYLYAPSCCFPMGRKVADVLEAFEKKLKVFGRRTQEAALNDGQDFKAYMHAMRVIWQLEEYLETQELSFPNRRREELLKIRAREFDRTYLENWINEEVLRIQDLPNNLPDAPDEAFFADWLVETYMQEAVEQGNDWLQDYYTKCAERNSRDS